MHSWKRLPMVFRCFRLIPFNFSLIQRWMPFFQSSGQSMGHMTMRNFFLGVPSFPDQDSYPDGSHGTPQISGIFVGCFRKWLARGPRRSTSQPQRTWTKLMLEINKMNSSASSAIDDCKRLSTLNPGKDKCNTHTHMFGLCLSTRQLLKAVISYQKRDMSWYHAPEVLLLQSSVVRSHEAIGVRFCRDGLVEVRAGACRAFG